MVSIYINFVELAALGKKIFEGFYRAEVIQ